MKNRTFIIIFAALLALLIPAALLIGKVGGGKIACVYRSGELIQRIDLSAVEDPYSITLDDGNGHINVLEIEPGRIRVSEANCPDKVCVNTGWLERGLTPIVCIPSGLVIRLENADDGIDAVTGGLG